MSIIFQTEERKILMMWDKFLQSKNRYLGIFIHDGGCVEKLEGETEFPKELLQEGSDEISRCLAYEYLKITQKEIISDWKPYRPQETQYDVKKREFEKRNFLVGSVFCCIHADGYIEYMKKQDAKTKFENWNIDIYDEKKQQTISRSFLDMWLKDENRKQYERIDFNPDVENCPKEIYNLFKGFKAEKYEIMFELTKEEIDKIVEPILQHLDYLTSGYKGRIIKFLANIIQTPHIKSEVAILIRDEGNLFIEGGGTGKNVIFEWVGNEIMGEDYIHIIGDNKELYTPFNSLFEGKLLIFVEEASGKENHSNVDHLKSKITSKTINVNKKMVAQYKSKDFSRYIFTSNSKNPMPIKQGNRRIEAYDTNPIKRGDMEYFKELIKHLKQDKTKWAFFQFLKTVETYDNPIDFQNNIPITKAYKEIRLLNAPLYHKWLVSCLKRGSLENGSTTMLYEKFVDWVKKYREGKEETLISQTVFGSLLTNAKGINKENENDGYNLTNNLGVKTKTHGNMYMTGNFEGLVEGLKNIHLLDEDFVYEPIKLDGCQVDFTDEECSEDN